MALFLRKIKKSKWYKNAHVSWLPEGELQADALSDLKTEDNKLSVYFIDDDCMNLRQVIAALSAKCDECSVFEYVIIKSEYFDKHRYTIKKTPGDSRDESVNANWHWDFMELSAKRLLEVATYIRELHSDEKIRILSDEVFKMVKESVRAGKIPIASINWKNDTSLKNQLQH